MLKIIQSLVLISCLSINLHALDNCTDDASTITNDFTYGVTIVQIFLGATQVLTAFTSIFAEMIYYRKALGNPKILTELDDISHLRKEREQLAREERKLLPEILRITIQQLKNENFQPGIDDQKLMQKLIKVKAALLSIADVSISHESVSL